MGGHQRQCARTRVDVRFLVRFGCQRTSPVGSHWRERPPEPGCRRQSPPCHLAHRPCHRFQSLERRDDVFVGLVTLTPAEDQPNYQDLALRVYTTRLLGGEPRLVLHGGGNTSVKTRLRDLNGEDTDVLCVKGSGWDMGTIEPPGLQPR